MTVVISDYGKGTAELFLNPEPWHKPFSCFVIGHGDRTPLPDEWKHLAKAQEDDAEFLVVVFDTGPDKAFAAAADTWAAAGKKSWFYMPASEELHNACAANGWSWADGHGMVPPSAWTISELTREQWIAFAEQNFTKEA